MATAFGTTDRVNGATSGLGTALAAGRVPRPPSTPFVALRVQSVWSAL